MICCPDIIWLFLVRFQNTYSAQPLQASCTSFFFVRIFSDFYVGSMCLMRLLHLARSCTSSPDNSLSDKSLLMLSNHFRFGLPVIFSPRHLHHHQSLVHTLFFFSSRYMFIPFNLLSWTFSDTSPTFVVQRSNSFIPNYVQLGERGICNKLMVNLCVFQCLINK